MYRSSNYTAFEHQILRASLSRSCPIVDAHYPIFSLYDPNTAVRLCFPYPRKAVSYSTQKLRQTTLVINNTRFQYNGNITIFQKYKKFYVKICFQ